MIGERLKGWRIKKGLSQAKTGEMLGITREYVGRVESGKNPSSAIIKQIEDLISESDSEQVAISVHPKRPSDPPPGISVIAFQALSEDLAEMEDEWLIQNIDYFYNDIMNADDCRTRLTHIGTLANLLKEVQDRLIGEWKNKRHHFPKATDILKEKGRYLGSKGIVKNPEEGDSDANHNT